MRKELTVSRRYPSSSSLQQRYRPPEPVPFVRLSGQWLRRLGFSIGSKIAVEAEDGRLVLTALPAPDAAEV